MKKIRKIKKITAVISAAALFAAMTSCGSTEAPKNAEEKQSAATTQSAKTEQETQPIIEDTANGERETISFERTADNEITTADGKFTISYEAELSADRSTLTVTESVTNNSGETAVLDIRPRLKVYTDLTDPDTIFAFTAEYQGTKINAGETAQSTVERTLEEGWSEGDAELWLRAQTDTDCAYDYAGDEAGFEFKI